MHLSEQERAALRDGFTFFGQGVAKVAELCLSVSSRMAAAAPQLAPAPSLVPPLASVPISEANQVPRKLFHDTDVVPMDMMKSNHDGKDAVSSDAITQEPVEEDGDDDDPNPGATTSNHKKPLSNITNDVDTMKDVAELSSSDEESDDEDNDVDMKDADKKQDVLEEVSESDESGSEEEEEEDFGTQKSTGGTQSTNIKRVNVDDSSSESDSDSSEDEEEKQRNEKKSVVNQVNKGLESFDEEKGKEPSDEKPSADEKKNDSNGKVEKSSDESSDDEEEGEDDEKVVQAKNAPNDTILNGGAIANTKGRDNQDSESSDDENEEEEVEIRRKRIANKKVMNDATAGARTNVGENEDSESSDDEESESDSENEVSSEKVPEKVERKFIDLEKRGKKLGNGAKAAMKEDEGRESDKDEEENTTTTIDNTAGAKQNSDKEVEVVEVTKVDEDGKKNKRKLRRRSKDARKIVSTQVQAKVMPKASIVMEVEEARQLDDELDLITSKKANGATNSAVSDARRRKRKRISVTVPSTGVPVLTPALSPAAMPAMTPVDASETAAPKRRKGGRISAEKKAEAQELLLDLVRNNATLSQNKLTAQVSEQSGVSVTTVVRYLRELIKDNKIERLGGAEGFRVAA